MTGKNKLPLWITGIAIFLYGVSMVGFKLDPDLKYQWLWLFLWLASMVLAALVWMISLLPYKNVLKAISIRGLMFILVLAVITRLVWLAEYPFVSLGDELRDGGLNAQQIANGEIKNIFGYGRYNAHGLIIPTFTAGFYRILGGDVLVYRLPAALIAVLDILLVYILLSLVTKNKAASVLGAMVLISLPLHLFYSRTQIVVIINSLFSTVIIFGLYVYFRRKGIKLADYVFLGTMAGFTFNLHASIKAMGIIVYGIIGVIVLFLWLSKRLKVIQLGIRLILLTVFLFVGFGPRLFNTLTPELFFHTTRLPMVKQKETKLDIVDRYKKSILVWVKEPTNVWYQDHKPILTPPIFGLMLLGMLWGIRRKNGLLISMTSIALILHLTNSALTDILNGDHRLSPLFSFGAVFAGAGIAVFSNSLRIRSLKYIFVSAVFVWLAYQTGLFFKNKPADKTYDTGDYLSMQTIYFLKLNRDFTNTNPEITFAVSPVNYKKYNLLHYKEQYRFFFPKTTFKLEENKIIKNNEIYIRSSFDTTLSKNYIIRNNMIF